MIKWLEKKLLERLIKDVIKELPKFKVTARLLLQEKKEVVLNAVKEAIKEKIFELVKKL